MSYFRRSLFLIFALSLGAFAQLRQVAIVDVPGRPGFDQLVFANGMLVMAHGRADTVDIFNPQLRRVEKQVTGLSDPRGLAVDDVGKHLFIANAGNNTITVVSTESWNVLRSLPLSVPPDELLWVSETKTLYAGSARSNSIVPIAPDAGTVGDTITFDGRPGGFVFDPARRELFVSLEDNRQVVVVGPEGKMLRRFPLAAWQPTGMALDGSNRLFVCVRYAVLVLDPATGAELARIPAPAGVDSLWLDRASHNLYVAASGGSVSVIQLENGRYVTEGELQTHVRGHTLAFDPAKGLLYMPGGQEGRSKVLILRRVENPNRPVSVVAGQPITASDVGPKLAEKKQ